jgi:DUF2934 family protein
MEHFSVSALKSVERVQSSISSGVVVMTTNDKRPRRTTKTAKTAKAPGAAGASESPPMSDTAKTADAAKMADALKTASAAKAARPVKPPSASSTVKTPALDKIARTDTAPAPVAGVSRAENSAVLPASAAATGARRIRAISVSVTSRHHEDRHASIALAAYFRSESRGFAPGHEVEDWLAAEEEVDQRLLGEGRAS